MKTTKFRHPTNGYIEDTGNAPGLWCFLFGPLYFASRGMWGAAAMTAILVLVTFGLSWLVMPFFARGMIETYYLRRGWLVS